jgi:hypothetical protein
MPYFILFSFILSLELSNTYPKLYFSWSNRHCFIAIDLEYKYDKNKWKSAQNHPPTLHLSNPIKESKDLPPLKTKIMKV